MNSKQTATFATFMRTSVFGVEDSLVSTVGLLSGVAAADMPRTTIILTGLILIFVEAVSMAAGSFISETSAEIYLKKIDTQSRTSFFAGIIMFFSYFFAGFIPLAPYIFASPPRAFLISISVSLCSLFALGALSAKISETNLLKNGVRMLIIGGIALSVGVLIGKIFRGF